MKRLQSNRPTATLRPAAPQAGVLGRRMLDEQLVAEGFVEAVTHTLVSEAVAAPFVAAGSALLRTSDDRDGGDTMLRPSILPSLLRVRRHNQGHGAATLRLFEHGSVFHVDDGASGYRSARLARRREVALQRSQRSTHYALERRS